MDKKTVLRTNAKELRKTLELDKISAGIVQKIRLQPIYQNAQNVMLFYPANYEINLLALLEDTKNFYLPKVNNKDLQVCPYKPCDKLNKSKFNILEPCSAPIKPNNLDLVIVPALMADKKGYRLGYGGGFYDRFLRKNPDIASICVVARQLLTNELPFEKFDIAVDYVITD